MGVGPESPLAIVWIWVESVPKALCVEILVLWMTVLEGGTCLS